MNTDPQNKSKHQLIRDIQHLHNPKIIVYQSVTDSSSKKCTDTINTMRKQGPVSVIIVKDV